MSAFPIVTERFLLRPLTPDDASPAYSSWFEEPQAARYIVAARAPHDPAALRAYIAERCQRRDIVFLGIFARDGGRHIGNIKFEPVDEPAGYAVMGILIGDRAWRGKGATVEVLKASTAWLAEHRGIREVVLGVERDHAAAIQAYERAGFRIERTQRIAVDPGRQIAMVRRIEATERPAYSLILMSRNRPQFVARLLDYYRSHGLQAQILLSDASDTGARGEVDGMAARYRDALDLVYTRYPGDAPPLQRLALEMGKVATPYAAWVGDDDFLIPGALGAASVYLDAHTDCAAVIGRALLFAVEGDAAHGKVAGIGPYQQLACEQAEASERMVAEAHHGTAYTYALRRTETVNRNLADFDPAYWPDDPIGYQFFEIMDGLLTSLAGRVAALDDLMLLRQVHARSTAAAGRETHKLYRIILHPRWPEFSRNVIDTLSAALQARQPDLSPAQCTGYAELALCMRIGTTLQKSTTLEVHASRPGKASAVDAAKRLMRRIVPGLSRGKALLLQRLKLHRKDYGELEGIVRLIESNGGGHDTPTRQRELRA